MQVQMVRIGIKTPNPAPSPVMGKGEEGNGVLKIDLL